MRVGVCIVLSLVLAGCGGRKFFNATPDAPPHRVAAAADTDPSAEQSLEQYMSRVRRAMADAHPQQQRVRAPHAESTDPALAAVIALATARPSPATYRAAAREYLRLGISDQALDYLQRALALDPRDAATYDAMARIWRDGGLLDRGLADAYRAVYYAPASASVHNTLGTVLQALGRRNDARGQYERALALDPAAAYALNNLCYGWFLDHQLKKAEAACQSALALAPTLTAARNNLGLALAAGGEIASARAAFEGIGDAASVQYNLGIVQLARRRYSDAVAAFAAAQQARPSWAIAAAREKQARRFAESGAEE